MKRIISVALAVVMVLALSVSAFAYDPAVELGIYIGGETPDGVVTVSEPGEYTVTYEGPAKGYAWIFLKSTESTGQSAAATSIPEGTKIVLTELVINGEKVEFPNGESYEYTVPAEGKVEVAYYFEYALWEAGEVFADARPYDGEISSLSATFVVDPDNAAEETTPADDAADDEAPSAPAESTDTETTETPAETGIVLAVLPMAVAAAAVVVAKKRK